LEPDVILLDLEMPNVDGVEALQRLQRGELVAGPSSLPPTTQDERILGPLRAGARGYLLKGASRAGHLLRHPHRPRRGLAPQPAVQPPAGAASAKTRDEPPPRELEVCALARGLKNAAIAERPFITERTVKFHVGSILAKLGADNRTEAVTIAANRGLVRLTD
jgi:DNA-binding NarL/FixJ family response regulator